MQVCQHIFKKYSTTNRTQPYKPLPLHTCTLTHKISNKFLCCVEKFWWTWYLIWHKFTFFFFWYCSFRHSWSRRVLCHEGAVYEVRGGVPTGILCNRQGKVCKLYKAIHVYEIRRGVSIVCFVTDRARYDKKIKTKKTENKKKERGPWEHFFFEGLWVCRGGREVGDCSLAAQEQILYCSVCSDLMCCL